MPPPNPETPIRILLVGGQRLFAKAFEARLRDSRFELAAVALDPEEAGAQAEALSPDIVLVDAAGGQIDAVAATRRVSRQEATSKIVVLTSEERDVDTADDQRVGAIACVRKPLAVDDRVETLELVISLLVETARAESG